LGLLSLQREEGLLKPEWPDLPPFFQRENSVESDPAARHFFFFFSPCRRWLRQLPTPLSRFHRDPGRPGPFTVRATRSPAASGRARGATSPSTCPAYGQTKSIRRCGLAPDSGDARGAQHVALFRVTTGALQRRWLMIDISFGHLDALRSLACPTQSTMRASAADSIGGWRGRFGRPALGAAGGLVL